MKYQLGFEIKDNIERDDLLYLILQEAKKEEDLKIEARLSPIKTDKELETDSLTEIISKKIAELQFHKQQRQSSRIYLKVKNLSEYERKETYWLNLLSEKLGVIAIPLTLDELAEADDDSNT